MPDFVLSVTGLTKRYGDLLAVDGLDLEVRRGEILGFLGPNGAGKTTALRMMCGLLRPDAGRIVIDSQPLLQGRTSGLGAVGVSPQGIVIWATLTCREQLEFMGRMYGLARATARERAGHLLSVFGLQEKAGSLGRALSGGMQRRLNIALALVHEPGILFLDEPQAGLDPQSRVLVRDYVRSLRGRMTVVITTHDMEEADKLADRVCIIDRGRVLVLDTVAGIKRQLGDGDLCEIDLNADAGAALPHLRRLERPDLVFSARGSTLCFASTSEAGILAEVLQEVGRLGLRPVGLRMREVTLEDVFIRLTGRGLRE
jgi:ABC-2 type transport system ATP-binding protein